MNQHSLMYVAENNNELSSYNYVLRNEIAKESSSVVIHQ